MRRLVALLGLGALALGAMRALKAPPRVLLPQGRTAFRCDEAVEVAVAGLRRSASSVLMIEPLAGSAPVRVPLRGDGRSIVLRLAPGVLAPGSYALRLDGRIARRLTIVSGVDRSPLLMSRHGQPSGSLMITSADSFGRLDRHGRPHLGEPMSAGLRRLDDAVARDLPVLVYTYWTGWVTHHPFGKDVSWCAPATLAAMRMSSLHAAQRLRRFGRSIVGVGAIDEPLLGDPPAWDEAAWYDALGGASCEQRVETLRRLLSQARDDLRTVWPEVSFRTDLWAPERRRHGCDPLLQEINEVPTTHVFTDQGFGRGGLIGALAVARAARPADKLAHAVNGPLGEAPAGRRATRDALLLTRNLLLGAGIRSSWWLNEGPLTPDDLAWLDEPALRLGGLFDAMSPIVPEIAVLWSSRTADYEGIVALVSAVHRCGYAARVVHEARLAEGGEVLLVVGVSHAPPGVERWKTVAGDEASLPHLPARTQPLPWTTPPRWAPLARIAAGVPARAAAYLQTTHCMDAPMVAQVPSLRAFLDGLGVLPLFRSESVHLLALRQQAGGCALTVLVNAFESTPTGTSCELYNHAAHAAEVTLSEAGPLVLCVEGASWDRVRRLENGTQQLTFEAGEAKLLLSVPRAPTVLNVEARCTEGWIEVEVAIDVEAVWPLEVRLDEGVWLHRATDCRGRHRERLPRGTNAAPAWRVQVRGLLDGLQGEAAGRTRPLRACIGEYTPSVGVYPEDAVQVFDETAIRALLLERVLLTVASDDTSAAHALAAALRRVGVPAQHASQREMATRARYPRVWPSTIVVHGPRGRAHTRCVVTSDPSGRVRVRLRRGNAASPHRGEILEVDGDGLAIADDLLFVEPGALVRWTGTRWIPFQTAPLEVRTEARVQARWSRPWRRLSSYRGDDRVPPQPPEAYAVDDHLVLLGDGVLSRALAASELLPRDVQAGWPGPGRAALMFAWSPFALDRNAIIIVAEDGAGRKRGVERLLALSACR